MGDSRLKGIDSRKAKRALVRLGFEAVRQNGSHVMLHRPRADGGTDPCVLPMKGKRLSAHTLASTLEQGKVSVDEFLEAL